MSQLGTMNVTVGADISQLLAQIVMGGKSLNNFQEQLKRFKDKLANATDPAAIIRLNAAIAATQQRISTINNAGANASSGLNRIAPSSNSAAFALTNLGRVAQDAPFGFIGIQNNLNPLLESFQRLKAESGSTGGALRAMASSLTGVGGLGLAVSVATAALTVLTQQGFFKSKKAAEETADANKKLSDSYKNITSDLATESSKVAVLVSQLQQEGITRKQREEAIERLQNISPAYFANLDKENATIKQITAAYNLYSKSILRSIEAKVNQKQLEDITTKILDLEKQGTDVGLRKEYIDGKLVTVRKQQFDYSTKINKGLNDYQRFQEGTLGLSLQQLDTLKNYKLTQKELIDLVAKNQGLETLNVKQSDTKKEKKADTKDIKEKAETIEDVLGKLRTQIKELNIEEGLLNDDKGRERVSAFLSAIKTLVIKYKLDPEGKLVQGLFDEAKFAKLGFIYEKGFLKLGKNASANFQKSFFTAPEEIPSPISYEKAVSDGVDYAELFRQGLIQKIKALKIKFSFDKTGTIDELTKALQAGQEKLLQYRTSLTNILESTTENILVSFSDTLGKVIAGDVGIGALFGSISKQLAAGLKQMGQYLIQTAITFKLAKSILGKNPALGAIAGVAMIALGSLIESKINKVPGFANGVNNFRGGFAVVGERGPELVNLPSGSNVIPNNQLSGKIGGENAVQLSGVFRISGNDLVASIDRTNKTNSRIT
jgi:hypothetical protein